MGGWNPGLLPLLSGWGMRAEPFPAGSPNPAAAWQHLLGSSSRAARRTHRTDRMFVALVSFSISSHIFSKMDLYSQPLVKTNKAPSIYLLGQEMAVTEIQPHSVSASHGGSFRPFYTWAMIAHDLLKCLNNISNNTHLQS